jgi:isopropylmalate/homocitrate/citramalate synthase
MEKSDKINIKMFDGHGFSIWKYHMEIIFKAKDVLHVVNGTEKRPTAAEPAAPTELEKERISAWQKKNSEARMLISKLITLKILNKIARCQTAYDMWKKLSALYFKKT